LIPRTQRHTTLELSDGLLAEGKLPDISLSLYGNFLEVLSVLSSSITMTPEYVGLVLHSFFYNVPVKRRVLRPKRT
jgi:hypothetical protein